MSHFYGLPDDPNRVALLPPVMLRIVQYEGNDGVYLFYRDSDGVELTDTLHDSVEQAHEQARFEFNVDSTEWERP